MKPQELLGQDFESILCLEKHAGAELGQAQIKLEFGLYFKQTLLKMIIKTEKGYLSTSITCQKLLLLSPPPPPDYPPTNPNPREHLPILKQTIGMSHSCNARALIISKYLFTGSGRLGWVRLG